MIPGGWLREKGSNPMSVSSNTRRRLFTLGAAAATTALLLAPATSANARPDTARLDASAAKGTTVAVAQDRLADRLDRDLSAAQSGGAYIDKAGELVVTVTDRAAARQVNASGATSRQVAYSSAQLDDVKRTLDRFAKSSGAGAAQGWFVDVRSNNVVVTATKGASNAATAQFLDKARSFGDRVAINRTTADAVPAALYGGQQVNMSNGFICSNGFNAQTSSGQYILLTAGHCAEGNPTFSRNGTHDRRDARLQLPRQRLRLGQHQRPGLLGSAGGRGHVQRLGPCGLRLQQRTGRLLAVQERTYDRMDLRHDPGVQPDRELRRR